MRSLIERNGKVKVAGWRAEEAKENNLEDLDALSLELIV